MEFLSSEAKGIALDILEDIRCGCSSDPLDSQE